MTHEHADAWDEFREIGLLWWVNRVLHVFGWVIYVEVDTKGKTTKVFPGRCTFTGFTEEGETRGHERLQAYIKRGFK